MSEVIRDSDLGIANPRARPIGLDTRRAIASQAVSRGIGGGNRRQMPDTRI